jgi:hypothetical protein
MVFLEELIEALMCPIEVLDWLVRVYHADGEPEDFHFPVGSGN